LLWQNNNPETATTIQKGNQLIEIQGTIFNQLRQDVIAYGCYSFHTTAFYKTKIQSIYNTLKGVLDTKTKQYLSINLPINAGFEQKYMVQMLVS